MNKHRSMQLLLFFALSLSPGLARDAPMEEAVRQATLWHSDLPLQADWMARLTASVKPDADESLLSYIDRLYHLSKLWKRLPCGLIDSSAPPPPSRPSHTIVNVRESLTR